MLDVIGFAIVGTDPKSADANNTETYPNITYLLDFLIMSNNLYTNFCLNKRHYLKTITSNFVNNLPLKAVVIRKHGDPDVLSYEEIRNPTPKKDHVIVKVDYCAVNHLDIWVRNGLPGKKVSFPHILGCDVCGTLVNDSGSLKKNEKVVIYPAVDSGNPRVSYSIIGAFGKYQGG